MLTVRAANPDNVLQEPSAHIGVTRLTRGSYFTCFVWSRRMSSEIDKQIEAAKALENWSKWLISIETALSAVLIALAQSGQLSAHPELSFFALSCFVSSVLVATVLLGNIPGTILDAPHENTELFGRVIPGIYNRKFLHSVKHWLLGLPNWLLALLEHLLFAAGLLSLWRLGYVLFFPS
jgi:hypothetical protein